MYICSYVHTIERMALMAMVKDTALGRPEAAEAAELLKVLGDCTRVMVLQTLIQAEELCVGDLAEAVDMSPSSVSHHLRVLRQAHLVRFRRAGREVLYAPDDQHVEHMLSICVEHMRHRGEEHA